MEFSEYLQWDRMAPFFAPPCTTELPMQYLVAAKAQASTIILSNRFHSMDHFKNIPVAEGHIGRLLQWNPAKGPGNTKIHMGLVLSRIPRQDDHEFCSIWLKTEHIFVCWKTLFFIKSSKPFTEILERLALYYFNK